MRRPVESSERTHFDAEVLATLLGLIAATGLRVSEALDLRLSDVLPDGILDIRHTKFGKARPRAFAPHGRHGFGSLPRCTRRLAITDDHVFVSAGDRRIASST